MLKMKTAALCRFGNIFASFLISSALLSQASCKRDEVFPDLNDQVASPVDVAVSDSGKHFYIINADFDRTYNKGSIMVIDEDGKKIKTVEIPRMARIVSVAGNAMVVTFDRRDDDNASLPVLTDARIDFLEFSHNQAISGGHIDRRPGDVVALH